MMTDRALELCNLTWRHYRTLRQLFAGNAEQLIGLITAVLQGTALGAHVAVAQNSGATSPDHSCSREVSATLAAA